MKRTLLILAGMVAIACSKVTPTTTVTFGYSHIESGAMTKTTRADTLQEEISKRIPTEMSLKLTSMKTFTDYNTHIGETIVIPVGQYQVYGKSECVSLCKINFTSNFLSGTPQLEVKEKVELTSGINEKRLTARFICSALVIDTKEVEKVTISSDKCQETQIPFQTAGQYGIIFMSGSLGSLGCKVSVYPKNREIYDMKTFRLYTERPGDPGNLEQGRYYVLHPTAVERMDVGFGFDVPPMLETELK